MRYIWDKVIFTLSASPKPSDGALTGVSERSSEAARGADELRGMLLDTRQSGGSALAPRYIADAIVS